ELACPSIASERALVRIELEHAWIVASIPRPGWVAALNGSQRRIFEVALAGFYKRAAVDLVREQLEHVLAITDGLPRYAIDDVALLVWPTHNFETEVTYNLLSSRHRR